MSVAVKYKGMTITTLGAWETKTLTTGGKYCEADIVLMDSGGGGGASKSDVNFYDYDGTIVASYSASDFASLMELPENPSHTGLTAQGWNWTLADAKTYVASYGKLDVGQMYITDDGKTRLYIRLEEGRLAPYLGIAINGTATVDWGDGSTSTVTGTSTNTVISTQHIYAGAGDYVIAIALSGYMGLVGDSSYGSQVLWKNSTTGNLDRPYQNAIQKVEIGANTAINGRAFQYCHSLTSITIPNGVKVINQYAFQGCYSLTSITVPSSVTSIGVDAFLGCYSLTSVMISSNVTSIGIYAFQSCYSLTSITIPSSVTSLPNYAFYSCSTLTSITIPNEVKAIGQYAFYNCYSLPSIMIPSNVTSIGIYAFQSCYSLTSITIPNGVKSLSNYVLRGCYSLTSITVPSSVTSLGTYAFQGCSGLGYIKFEPTKPPTVSASNTFSNLPNDCIIYVPQGTLSMYTTATNYPSSSTYTYVEY